MDEIANQIDRNIEIMHSAPVEEAAKAICRARCALFDRDPNCQDHGRCGKNWNLYVGRVFQAITRPAFD